MDTLCPAKIRIGTRSSKLAVAQAIETKNRLLGAFPELTQEQIELVKIITTGDKIQDRSLAEIGGKGLFTLELEEQLADGRLDLAVHSYKDMPDTLPDGLRIECVLEREDPRDALVSVEYASLDTLPKGARVGTSSLRRQAQILRLRPDLEILPIRGNVLTRMQKLEDGQFDAIIMAVAGLKRLDMAESITQIMQPEEMLPAVCQGAICVEIHESHEHIAGVLQRISHRGSTIRATAERAILHAIDGSCTTPLGGFAEIITGNKIEVRGELLSPDGKTVFTAEASGSLDDAQALGLEVGEKLKHDGKALL